MRHHESLTGKGEFHGYGGSFTGARADAELAAQVMHAFFHAYQAQAADTAGVEAVAVVFDGQQNFRSFLADFDHHFVRLGVAGAVVERFLDDAIDAGLVGIGELAGVFIGGDFDAQSGAFGDFAGLPFERGNQAQIVQHRRAQEQAHIADDVDAGFGQALDGFDVAADFSGVRRDARGGVAGFDQERGEGLAHLIVQFAGDAAALLLLGGYQAGG